MLRSSRRTVALTVCLAGVAAATGPLSSAEAATTTIAQIQGAGHVSPLAGQNVTGVQGVVTAVSSSGFYLQSTTPDDNDATSEAILVYTGKAPTTKVGDAATVSGKVTEFRPGGADGVTNLSTTEIASPTVQVTASGQALPAPVILGKDRTAPAQTIRTDNPGDVETSSLFDVRRNALDFYESLEGMRVGLDDATTVGPSNSYGELPVVPGKFAQALRTDARGVNYASYRLPNAMRVILDDPLLPKGALPASNTGDTLPGTTVGVMDYSFGNFKLLLTETPQHRSGGVTRDVAKPQNKRDLSVATFNVENLAPSDSATKFSRLATQITTNLRSPDVLTLEEIQDNSGSRNDGVVASGTTVTKLINAIAAAGGPAYSARWIDPVDLADGGQPGGNIRQVFLYRTDRGVSFVDRRGGNATTAAQVVGTGANTHLSVSPGRIAPNDAAWTESRKPLVGEFRFRGKSWFVVANHFASKGGDQPLFGRYQQPQRSSEQQRLAQATVVRTFTDQLLKADPSARLVVAGDLNDFEFSPSLATLTGSGRTALTDLPATLAPRDRYTYVYDGNSQVLDHILISPALTRKGNGSLGFSYEIVHTNSNFHDQDSDHDPQVVRLSAK
ncbi:endonuclease/exonuclease/phosphatase family protein [Dermacoccaceae bacterium W4C1]